MKRTVAFFAILVLLSTSAYAGVFDKVSGTAWSILISAAISGIGVFGLAYKLWAKVAKEGAEFAKAVFDAVQEKSPDGRKINDKEMERIVKEASDVYPALTAAIAATKKK